MTHPPTPADHPLLDLGLTGGLLVVCVLPYAVEYAPSSALLSLLLVLPVLARRTHPVGCLVTAAAAAVLQLVFAGTPLLSIIVVPLLVYSFARADERLGRIALIVAMVGALVGPLRWSRYGSLISGLALLGLSGLACAAIVAAAYLIGSRRRERALDGERQRTDEQERERLRQAEDEQRLRSDTAWERNRIARELHDIVAHSLSVIVVQAEGGRALTSRRPEEAPAVFGTIAETGREALTEMRRIVAVLRAGGEPDADYRPNPGLDDLADLVRKTLPSAVLELPDPLPPVSPTIGLTVYRTVQEALTNVLKHAGPTAQTTVSLAAGDGTLWVEVVDDGRGASVVHDGSGLGLRGMQERVAAVDGHLLARPRTGGGFEVRAAIPLTPVNSVDSVDSVDSVG